MSVSMITEIIADGFTPNITPGEGTFTLNAIKSGTIAHTKDGRPVEFCGKMLEKIAPTWEGGFIKYNHALPGVGKIIASKWEDPYVVMTISGLGDEVTDHLMANRHTGFSIDAEGDLDDMSTIRGTGVSILFDNHAPACNSAAGCGITGNTIMAETIENEAYKLHIDTLTDKLTASEAIVAERDQTIAGMKTAEEVETIIAEAAKALGVKTAAEQAAKDAVAKIFPNGVPDESKTIVAEAIVAQDYPALLAILAEAKPVATPAKLPSATDAKIEANDGGMTESAKALAKALTGLDSKYIGA